MATRRYTSQDIIRMPWEEFEYFRLCLNAKAFRLLGMNWQKTIRYWTDPPITGDLIFEYE